MSYTQIPELVAILWMAVVLARLRGREPGDEIHLWIFGLLLFVLEGVAYIVYQIPTSATVHMAMHVIALDAYFLAGIAFFQSATGRQRSLPHSDLYVFLCALPHLALLTMYGSGVRSMEAFLLVAILGFVLSLGAAGVFRRTPIHRLCHAVIWLPIIVSVSLGSFRYMAYESLFFAYMAAAIAFFMTVPPERRGRMVVVSAFSIWSLCFLSHPWLAANHQKWIKLAESIWDLQKFFVMFGLLTVSLEEQSAANQYQAVHDALTGLPNRRLFEDRLEQAIARANRNKSRLVLFNMDLDDFKKINDTFGHEAGDEVLREVSRRLLSVKREMDTLARMGGDEFYLLINDFNLPQDTGVEDTVAIAIEQARKLTEIFREAVGESRCLITLNGASEAVTCNLSIGSVVFPEEAADRRQLVRLADEKMYRDKYRKRAVGTVELALARSRGASSMLAD